MDQTVLMHADIDEGTEGRDVGDNTFQLHAGLQILHLLDTFLEGRRLEFRARVAAGLFQFLDDVGDGGHTEASRR